jgi:hypothetical protein
MSAECAELSIGQAGVGAFDVAAVLKSHEPRVRIDPCRRSYRRDAMPE